ncbi:hypothetical protein CHS0354_002072 [Potamilus streckersoni]|uniref:Tetrapyrrole biosynthesis uroporphyrinogen III synthase domain-containing protein n=1 Tax=Potamilus streckersoni TaxID=2493646 RepID=A0AAE0T6J6_9BIVA|nr:hypothetical protein CHS0354_002072 [Potamilus streckersoni]
MTDQSNAPLNPVHRVLFTAGQEKQASYKSVLASAGYAVNCIPLLKITAAEVLPDIQQKILQTDYAGIVFTSTNAVKYTFSVLPPEFTQKLTRGSIAVFCVGKRTASACVGYGISKTYTPDKPAGRERIMSIPEFTALSGNRILYPCGDLADGQSFITDLHRLNITADALTVYSNIMPAGADKAVSEYWKKCPPDAVILMSPSAVSRLYHSLNLTGTELKKNGLLSAGRVSDVKTVQTRFILSGATTEKAFIHFFPSYAPIIVPYPSPEGICKALSAH